MSMKCGSNLFQTIFPRLHRYQNVWHSGGSLYHVCLVRSFKDHIEKTIMCKH